jgi:hypothetical protein
MTFFCRAVEIPKKSVEQSRFEQLHFEQLTLTRNDCNKKGKGTVCLELRSARIILIVG